MILGKARTPRGCPDIFKNFIKILKPVARSRIASVLVIAFVMPRNKRNRNDIAFTPDLSANSLAHKRAKAAENRLARAQKIGNRGGFVYFLHILIIIFTKLFHDIYYLIYCPICCCCRSSIPPYIPPGTISPAPSVTSPSPENTIVPPVTATPDPVTPISHAITPPVITPITTTARTIVPLSTHVSGPVTATPDPITPISHVITPPVMTPITTTARTIVPLSTHVSGPVVTTITAPIVPDNIINTATATTTSITASTLAATSVAVTGPVTNLAMNRAAGSMISIGNQNQIKVLNDKQLFKKLMGKWNADTEAFERMEIMMLFMEAGIAGPGGGPVYGRNFSASVDFIRNQLTTVLNGTPSQAIVGAVVLGLFKVKPHVEKLMKDDDPQTGGGSPDPPAARVEEFYLKLSEFCFKNEEHARQKHERLQAQQQLRNGDLAVAPLINGPTRDSERSTTRQRQLFTPTARPATPTTRTTKNESESPTAFQLFLRDNAKAKMDRAAAATQLSDTHKRKTEVEIELLKQKQTESEFQFKMIQIEKLKETMDKFPADSVPYQVMSKKIENLVKDL